MKEFSARSLVGMTGGARRRAVRKRSSFPFGGTRYHEMRAKYRIGERLRACPGCALCGVRRFRKVGGFDDGTAYIEHRPIGCRMYRHCGGFWVFNPTDRRRWHSAQYYSLVICEAYVTAGTWEELTAERCKDGVLPARKARKARR